jgi:hypothetical protein
MSVLEEVMNAESSKTTVIKNYTYRPFTEKYYSEDLGYYVSHGISVFSHEKEVMRIPDVCTDLQRLSELCDRCTAEEADPIQILDIIEDFLGE